MKKSVLFLILGLFVFSYEALAANTNALRILEEISVQDSGRVKPFQSFAEETMLLMTGKKKLKGMSPTETVWRWMTSPEQWNKEPFLPASYGPLSEDFGLMIIKGKLSPEVVLAHQPFVEKVQTILQRRENKETLTELEKKQAELYERAMHFQQIGQGAVPGWIAHPEDPRKAWLPFQGFAEPEGQAFLAGAYSAELSNQVADALKNLFSLFHENPDSSETAEAAIIFRDSLARLMQSRDVILDQKILNMELQYNHLHPFGWSWKFYLLGALLLLMASFCSNQNLGRSIFSTGIILELIGFGFHTYGFYLRCLIAGRPPVTNMYESIIWVSWAVVLFSAILFVVYRAALLPITSGFIASLALILANAFPALFDPGIEPLVPVLRSNLWLTVHVLTITLSYGAFALAWGLGHVVVLGYASAPEKKERNLRLSEYLNRAIQIGVILLASGTVLGGVWANYSWGRFWGWDPKETWALIALLGYLTVLHGRFAGWLDTFGVAAASVFAFLGVVMAWYGVNYVLAAGLHSYGFGGGGAVYVLGVAFADFLLIGWAIFAYRNKAKELLKY